MYKPVVHILGLGSMGTLIASDLLKYNEVTVVPLLRSKEKLSIFSNRYDNTIRLRKIFLDGSPVQENKLCNSYCPETFKNAGPIENLVITTKTYQTKEALLPYLPYIKSHTNIILIQNGLGILELLKEEIFTDSNSRPQLFQGVISHGVYQDEGFTYNHAGWVGMKIARLPWENNIVQTNELLEHDKINNSLVNLLTKEPFCSKFGIEHLTYQELLLGQLHKFILNCCMNSVTAIMDCVNGEMREYCEPVFRLIIEESLDILAQGYPKLFAYDKEFKGKNEYPQLNVNSILSVDYLVKDIIKIGCVMCAQNSTSMRQDTLYLRKTEIDYINGYLAKLAQKLNLPKNSSKVNETIISMVNLRSGLNKDRAS
ncbi:hypothetical protein Kpol_1005p8 [Vanderwaltozyma polyspora DSM 70294]|uniref:2-dehydropantoate 2-reductase n=1 Tax=Vanderwaltozyma polyspora (strain ATCC 22028 / DSM 70294 / BCRC 21397 / CBS 2163 / NBRC 10782 / NRRL Y-8283 / UCD 57-17) TaxID=436907 RepID=A7TS34_VANPO|nr:uncharacterized protein Kpol_1005p8 [Vanderwaltozyma polyspora DSM 70294]EDO14920.1 hypothetical protein Kpol_1005p8 [Vanderwaltozyma polyspora DSM 70294]